MCVCGGGGREEGMVKSMVGHSLHNKQSVLSAIASNIVAAPGKLAKSMWLEAGGPPAAQGGEHNNTWLKYYLVYVGAINS